MEDIENPYPLSPLPKIIEPLCRYSNSKIRI
jgi:hypothetical protein